jgi:hypothetical protein
MTCRPLAPFDPAPVALEAGFEPLVRQARWAARASPPTRLAPHTFDTYERRSAIARAAA